jgi:hypothetical protein
MKLFFIHLILLTAVSSFLAPLPRHVTSTTVLQQEAAAETQLNSKLEEIAHKLRLQTYDVDTAVYGMESKNHLADGIEVIHTEVHMDDNGWLGLELTEVAHSNVDHRGLVLVSAVSDQKKHTTQDIQVGDTIIGVFVDDNFAESTTGLDYDETVKVINEAKRHSLDHGNHGRLTIELNRLVKRETVHVEIVDSDGTVTEMDALAGDNLRTLIMHHHMQLYDQDRHRLDQPSITGSNCGGEGICGTCVVAIEQGMDHLNKIGPQESSFLKGLPKSWRPICKTVVGADNLPGTTLRVRLHPHAQPSTKLSP